MATAIRTQVSHTAIHTQVSHTAIHTQVSHTAIHTQVSHTAMAMAITIRIKCALLKIKYSALPDYFVAINIWRFKIEALYCVYRTS
jgi:hypothetical protein